MLSFDKDHIKHHIESISIEVLQILLHVSIPT